MQQFFTGKIYKWRSDNNFEGLADGGYILKVASGYFYIYEPVFVVVFEQDKCYKALGIPKNIESTAFVEFEPCVFRLCSHINLLRRILLIFMKVPFEHNFARLQITIEEA